MANDQNLQIASVTAGNTLTLNNVRSVQVYVSVATVLIGDGTNNIEIIAGSQLFEMKADAGNVFPVIEIEATTGTAGVMYYQ